MDRLLGNAALQRQCADIYAGMARQILADCKQPVILVDWSDLKADRSVQLIRASLALHGRSLSLLEQVYGAKQAATPRTHTRFLRQLKAIVLASGRALSSSPMQAFVRPGLPPWKNSAGIGWGAHSTDGGQ
ncbi:hypothetical protein J1N44_21535 [Acidovorax temperans]|uniref:hypothetical protein n=1 Tax=Acidovorax temperans TaxID=80878 RepID=UPI001A947889|nr:hypothetical protein [Acidovorax temperans]MBO0944193.1 hypothetical protein [Acidovorax temperans]